MPSSATITAYYSFQANTKARSSQVNANFALYRGHIIPIEPLTATGSNLNYDLGSTEYRWRTGYFQTTDYASSTSTAAVQIKGFTSETAGALGVYVGGTLTGKFVPSGFDGTYMKTASISPTAFTQRARINSTFVTSTANVVIPDFVSHVILEGIGGGGGGGGGGLNTAANNTSGGAGGTSGLMGVIVVPVTAGETLTVTIPAAAAGGAGAVSAGVTATAGDGGGSVTVTGTFGTVTFPAGRGGPGGSASSVNGSVTSYQGGLSSSAGAGCITGVFGTPAMGDPSIRALGGAAGANGASGTGGGGGGGGFAPGGAGGAGTPANGVAGSLGSGGGGGGASTSIAPGTGGAGGKGCVIVHYVTYS